MLCFGFSFFPLLFFSPWAQVCVYGVAAILWATAKFSLSPNQKLAMPRKLKRLLLEMAKGTSIERPTIIIAKKVLFYFNICLKSLYIITHKTKTNDSLTLRTALMNISSCFYYVHINWVLCFEPRPG